MVSFVVSSFFAHGFGLGFSEAAFLNGNGSYLGGALKIFATYSFLGPSSLIIDFFSSTGADLVGSTLIGCSTTLGGSSTFLELVISPVADF